MKHIVPFAAVVRPILLAVAASIAWHAPVALAEDGVGPDTLTLGQVAALEGPAAALGVEMRRGLLSALYEANRQGGVKSHKIELVFDQ
jgi:branched-chain amino acid transport system substrate-binding protein